MTAINLSYIQIKPIEPTWAKAILDLTKDEIVEWAKVPSFSNQTDVFKWMEEIGYTTNRFCYAIIHNQFGFIGVINLAIIKASGYLSYWLGKPYWGKGYGTLAVQEFLTESIAKFKINKVFAAVDKTNDRSIRLLENLNFIQIKTQNDFLFFLYRSEKEKSKESLEKTLKYLLVALNFPS